MLVVVVNGSNAGTGPGVLIMDFCTNEKEDADLEILALVTNAETWVTATAERNAAMLYFMLFLSERKGMYVRGRLI